jgi:hypothetical protein
MAEKHRPDYAEINTFLYVSQIPAGLKDALNLHDKETLPSPSMMWPFINLEDLTKPKPLLIFLNARGRNNPFTFAITEEAFSPLAKMSLCEYEPHLRRYTLQVSDETTPARYVKVYPTDETKRYSLFSTDNSHICPRRGLQDLHIQHKIIEFLAACSKLILHDMSEDMLYCSAVQNEPPSSELELQSDLGFTTFADALMIAPYRNRGSVEFFRLRSYFDALCTNAKDHILALREDPSYFADAFKDICEHSSGLILDRHGNINTAIDDPCFLMCSAGRMVIDAYTMYFSWKELYQLANRLTKTPMWDPSGQFATLMAEFSCRAQQVSGVLYRMLDCASMSPNVRDFYVRSRRCITMQPQRMKLPEEFQLISSFECFNRGDDVDDLKGAALHLLLDHVTTIMREKKAARDLVSPRVSELFSQMSVMGECMMQLSVWSDTPQGSSYDKDAPHSHSSHRDFSNWMDHLEHHHMPIHLIKPFRGKLAYPAHKARNRSTVKVMRDAESKLDRFWQYIDDFYKAKTGISQHDIIRQCITEGGQMRRTAPWEEELGGHESKQQVKSKDTYQPFSEISHNRGMQITGAFDRLAVGEKTKPKTKGNPTPLMTNEIQVNMISTVDEDDARQVFYLDKRTLKAMKALFHVAQSDSEDIPKAVKWNEFKRAMARIGFAVEKLQGSAWQFTPGEALGVHRGIQFHEPHPDSDITYVMARRFGRRLERVYGWNGDSFQLV